jgi:lipopolysaccharide transport system ATP-binding protein
MPFDALADADSASTIPDSRSSLEVVPPVLECQAIGKRYRLYERPGDRLLEGLSALAPRWIPSPRGRSGQDFWALRNVSFSIRAGETVALIGRNGSGKSTLLQIVAGTVTPTEGRVAVRGRIAALLELGSGFNPEFTGLENVRMSAAILGLDARAIDRHLDSIVAFADIGPHLNQPVKTYSSGMFVRLAFAIAIHVDPDILLIDEALAVGDIAFQVKCVSHLRSMQRAGKTLLFVSHDVDTVRALCSRCIYLDCGSVRDAGPTPVVIDRFLRDLHADQSSGTAAVALDVITPTPQRLAGHDDFATRCVAFERARGAPHGRGDARIRLVEMVDQHDRVVTTAPFDAEVRIRIWVECVQGCTVSINYKIRDRHLVSVTGADFLIASQELIEMVPGGGYMVEYRTRLPLMAGHYSLRVSVTVPIDRHEQAIFIDVVEITAPFQVLAATRGRIYTQVYLPNSVSVQTYRQGEPP